ncbi:MAG: sugar transferase [Bryobacteraceae bacterium]|jgi:sugar transferase (PEP-CTERM system associated)
MRQLFRAFIPASLIGLILSELTLIFLCYLAGSWLVHRFLNPELDLNAFVFYEGGLLQIAVVAGCLLLGFYFQNLYSDIRVKSFTLLVQQTCLVIGFAFLMQALLAYARKPEWSLPRWAMIFGSILALIVIPFWRLFYSRVLLKVIGFQRVLFLGASEVSREIGAHLASRPEIGMSVLGYIDDTVIETELPGGRIIGRIKDLTNLTQKLRPDLIVVGLAERRQELPMSEMLHLRFSGVRFEEAAVTFEAAFGRVSTRQMRPSRLVFSSDLGPRKGSLFWHSLYSIPIAALLIILFAPVILLVAIAVKLTSPGPIFHRQVRVGLNGSTFTVYKFRSMYADAEARTGPVWATKDDPRITSAGKWMRRFRLDELPQLINVLRNEMALVGPRPERPEFVKSLNEKIPYYNYRHCVKPGITGWAQINYKYGDTLDDAIMKLEYDLYYIKNLAVSLDMYIIFHTLKVMLFSETAQ